MNYEKYGILSTYRQKVLTLFQRLNGENMQPLPSGSASQTSTAAIYVVSKDDLPDQPTDGDSLSWAIDLGLNSGVRLDHVEKKLKEGEETARAKFFNTSDQLNRTQTDLRKVQMKTIEHAINLNHQQHSQQLLQIGLGGLGGFVALICLAFFIRTMIKLWRRRQHDAFRPSRQTYCGGPPMDPTGLIIQRSAQPLSNASTPYSCPTPHPVPLTNMSHMHNPYMTTFQPPACQQTSMTPNCQQTVTSPICQQTTLAAPEQQRDLSRASTMQTYPSGYEFDRVNDERKLDRALSDLKTLHSTHVKFTHYAKKLARTAEESGQGDDVQRHVAQVQAHVQRLFQSGTVCIEALNHEKSQQIHRKLERLSTSNQSCNLLHNRGRSSQMPTSV